MKKIETLSKEFRSKRIAINQATCSLIKRVSPSSLNLSHEDSPYHFLCADQRDCVYRTLVNDLVYCIYAEVVEKIEEQYGEE